MPGRRHPANSCSKARPSSLHFLKIMGALEQQTNYAGTNVPRRNCYGHKQRMLFWETSKWALRPAFGRSEGRDWTLSTRIRPKSGPEDRFPARKLYRCLRKKRRSKPREFIKFGAMEVTNSYKFIWFGDAHGRKPYKFVWFRWPESSAGSHFKMRARPGRKSSICWGGLPTAPLQECSRSHFHKSAGSPRRCHADATPTPTPCRRRADATPCRLNYTHVTQYCLRALPSGPDCYREGTEIGPPAGRRAISMLSR
jgi:hypothetical protein